MVEATRVSRSKDISFLSEGGIAPKRIDRQEIIVEDQTPVVTYVLYMMISSVLNIVIAINMFIRPDFIYATMIKSMTGIPVMGEVALIRMLGLVFLQLSFKDFAFSNARSLKSQRSMVLGTILAYCAQVVFVIYQHYVARSTTLKCMQLFGSTGAAMLLFGLYLYLIKLRRIRLTTTTVTTTTTLTKNQ